MPLQVVKEKLSQVKGHLVTMPIGASLRIRPSLELC